jgi:hypothetical protein
MAGAEDSLADGQQGSQLITSASRIPRHPHPVGEFMATAQGVGVVRAEDSFADGQQGSELITSASRIPRHPHPVGESVAST